MSQKSNDRAHPKAHPIVVILFVILMIAFLGGMPFSALLNLIGVDSTALSGISKYCAKFLQAVHAHALQY